VQLGGYSSLGVTLGDRGGDLVFAGGERGEPWARSSGNQAGAIIAVLALLYVAEPLLGFILHLGTAIQRYGLGGLAAATTQTVGFPATARLLRQPAAALVLAGYATVALLAGAALLSRRDITT
jgi:hypothetical protein